MRFTDKFTGPAPLLVSLAVALATGACSGAKESASPEAGYVGAARCAPCHQEITARWRTTTHGNHAFLAAPEVVKGDFTRTNVYVYRGVTSRMSTRDDKYFMETEGPDGANHTYPVDLVLGWRQNQVYLTRFPDGRYQVLPTYYDLKANIWYDQTEGVVPSGGRKLTPKDQNFWANRGRTWNSGCAGCHASQAEKNYDPATNTYSTTWVDLTINCEACHGPGSRHVEAWTRAGSSGEIDPQEGGLVDLVSLSPAQQVEVCARCHAAKTVTARGYRPGDRFLDFYQPSVPYLQATYFSDGRNKGLNYNYIAHTQSGCYRKGNLVCTGCHDPHGAGHPVDLREPEHHLNLLCEPCHADMKTGLNQHTHHAPESPGSRCVECHMPYVDVSGRRLQSRDHTISVPVPAITKNFGTPNACNTCHRDHDPEWAAAAVQRWFHTDQKQRVNLTAAFFYGFRREPVAAPTLLALFADRDSLPSPRRAAIPMVLAGYRDPSLLAPLIPGLRDPEEDPQARYQIVQALAAVPGRLTDQALLEAVLLPDRALRRLAGVELARRGTRPPAPKTADAIDEVVKEYEGLVREVRADVPEDQANLGHIYLARADEKRAMEKYQLALRLNSDQPEVQIRLGTLYARRKRVEEAAACFKTAAELMPDSAVPIFNLGSLYLQAGRRDEAVAALSRALQIDPDHAEARYNLAVGQVESGRFGPAAENLRQLLTRMPRNPMVRYYLGRAYEGAGQRDRAADAYRQALAIAPDLADAREALSRLETPPGRSRP